MSKPRGLFVLDPESYSLIYGEPERLEIGNLVDIIGPPLSRDTLRAHAGLLRQADLVFSGWGAPLMDQAFLDSAVNLRAVFYGAGSIRYLVTEAFWNRDILITSAYAANAIPVAEYTVSAILLSLKQFWRFAAATRRGEGWQGDRRMVPGNFRRTVGLVSMGMIARKVVDLLKPYDLQVIAYCPFLTEAEARKLGIRRATLDEVFRTADVVSLHTPALPETTGLVTGTLVASMKDYATLINTSRGTIIAQGELVEVLRKRPDLTAVLDVTDPEPPEQDSPLLTMPNVVLTPHIAGSLAQECQRMGRYMVEELRRYLAGQPLRWRITREAASRLA